MSIRTRRASTDAEITDELIREVIQEKHLEPGQVMTKSGLLNLTPKLIDEIAVAPRIAIPVGTRVRRLANGELGTVERMEPRNPGQVQIRMKSRRSGHPGQLLTKVDPSELEVL